MRSTANEKKQILLSSFIETRRQLLDYASSIPSERHEQVFLGIWSIKDLLAHLIGWDHSNIEAIEAVSERRLPEFYAQIDKDWHSYNAHLVSLYKKGAVADLVKNAQVSHRALVDRLTATPARELFQDNGIRYRGYKVTIARLIEAEMGDECVHMEQVKGFAAKILSGV
ncbi:MAG: ClbS/DfsB family four-helix bundle protein [Chloroflexota bacterium]